jgi:hypothetical protein
MRVSIGKGLRLRKPDDPFYCFSVKFKLCCFPIRPHLSYSFHLNTLYYADFYLLFTLFELFDVGAGPGYLFDRGG